MEGDHGQMYNLMEDSSVSIYFQFQLVRLFCAINYITFHGNLIWKQKDKSENQMLQCVFWDFGNGSDE